MLWLVSYRVYIRLCKHGCDVTACFPVLFYKRNRKWTPCVYITWCKHERERVWKNLEVLMSNSPKLSLVFASGYINTVAIFYFLNNQIPGLTSLLLTKLTAKVSTKITFWPTRYITIFLKSIFKDYKYVKSSKSE